MALPAVINSVAQAEGDYIPFKSSAGNFYVVARVSDTTIDVFKSSDPGSVAFAAQDTSNNPSGFTLLKYMYAVQNGDVIHIATFDRTALNVEYHEFNMATDAWDTTDELVENLTGMDFPQLSIMACSIAFRSGVTSDELVIAYSGLTDSDMGSSYQRVDFSHKNDSATSWTGPVALSNQANDGVANNYGNPILAVGTNDKVHCYMGADTTSASDPVSAWDAQHGVTISTSNSLSTVITTTVDTGTNLLGMGNLISFDDGGTQRIMNTHRGASSTTRGTLRSVEDGSDDGRAVSLTNLTNSPVLSGETTLIKIANDGTDVYYVFSDASTSDLFIRKSSDSGATFDSEVEEVDGITVAQIAGVSVLDHGGDKLVMLVFDSASGDFEWHENDIGGAGATTLSPTAIASTEAFGTAIVNPGVVTLSPTAIASVEAFGTLALVTELITLSPTAISTAEAIGSATLSVGPVTLSPTGLTSKEVFGSATISVASITVSPTGITSDEAFGTAQLDFSTTLSPTAIAGAEAFGTLVVSTGVVTLSPTGLASGEALGAPVVTPGSVQLSPSAIASGEAHGSPTLSTGVVTVSPTGLATGEAFGTTVISTLQGTGIASVEALGTPTISVASITLSPTEITTAEALGTPALNFSVQLSPTAIASTEAFGTTVLSTTITASPSSITSIEAIGAAVISPGVVNLSPSAISSAEGIGSLSLTLGLVTISPTALTSSEIFGTPTLTLPIGGQTLTTVSIASGEKFGWVQDVQHENTIRDVAGHTPSCIEREYTLNWGRDSHLDRTYD